MAKNIDIQTKSNKLKFLTITSFLLMLCLVVAAYSAETAEKETNEIKNNIFNRHDREVGRVDEKGIIYNNFGRKLGSVDEDGIIYNVSDLKIGKVAQDGRVLNQSGTRISSVNEKGEIFNVSDIKIGYVKDVSDIKLVGAVARIVFSGPRSKLR